MEYTTLGKTGLRVSRMGFGGIPIQKVDASVTHTLMERLAQRGTVRTGSQLAARTLCIV